MIVERLAGLYDTSDCSIRQRRVNKCDETITQGNQSNGPDRPGDRGLTRGCGTETRRRRETRGGSKTGSGRGARLWRRNVIGVGYRAGRTLIYDRRGRLGRELVQEPPRKLPKPANSGRQQPAAHEEGAASYPSDNFEPRGSNRQFERTLSGGSRKRTTSTVTLSVE